MPASSKIASNAAAILMPFTLLAALGLASGARADDAQPCTGTLCDLYYHGSSGSAPAQPGPAAPPGATPLTVPSTGGLLNFFKSGSSSTPAAPAGEAAAAAPQQTQDSSWFKVVGGHSSDEPCTGTLCDLYHGTVGGGSSASSAGTAPATASSTPPNASAAPAKALAPSAGYIAPREAAVAQVQVDPALLEQNAQRRRMAEAAREARARCHNPNDPWHCLR